MAADEPMEPSSSQWDGLPATQSGHVQWQATQPSNRALGTLMRQAKETHSVGPSKLSTSWDASTTASFTTGGSASSSSSSSSSRSTVTAASSSKFRRPSMSNQPSSTSFAYPPQTPADFQAIIRMIQMSNVEIMDRAYAQKRLMEEEARAQALAQARARARARAQALAKSQSNGKGKERARPYPDPSARRSHVGKTASLPGPTDVRGPSSTCAVSNTRSTDADTAFCMDVDVDESREMTPSLSAEQMPPPPVPPQRLHAASTSSRPSARDPVSGRGIQALQSVRHDPARAPKSSNSSEHSAPPNMQPSPPLAPIVEGSGAAAPSSSQTARKAVLGMTARGTKTLQSSTTLPTRQKGFKPPFAKVASAPAGALPIGDTNAASDTGRPSISRSGSGNINVPAAGRPPQHQPVALELPTKDNVNAKDEDGKGANQGKSMERDVPPGSPPGDGDSSYGDISIDMDALDEVMSQYD
ncbi:hypothetical protein PUNSTDRAFT_47371 [Punctularia strigosozonata HHB-11173 SS5]|uniref:Uncharacterized protein n=1 Tax=Punctularia strigosozonata (strain HHB-11173) TaxID=741275 RepID=R7S3G8_PUNST|nr:uncharacterized protein PUNSTDRAFT_47371 [Punctularia strigosozonata HHB-11173 SS5]EIN04738.1 hypothetical protein PUNSTDRAFT_47371 [Punctularia strigosozonata HHB-11173 SS5]